MAAWAIVAMAFVAVGAERSYPDFWSGAFGSAGWLPGLASVGTFLGLLATLFFLYQRWQHDNQTRELDQLSKAAGMLASEKPGVRRVGVYMLKALAQTGTHQVGEAHLALSSFAGGEDNAERDALWQSLRSGTLRSIEPLHPGRARAALDALTALLYIRPPRQAWWKSEDEPEHLRVVIDGMFAQSAVVSAGNGSRMAFTNFIADRVTFQGVDLTECQFEMWIHRPIKFSDCDMNNVSLIAHGLDGNILDANVVLDFVVIDPTCRGLQTVTINGWPLSQFSGAPEEQRHQR